MLHADAYVKSKSNYGIPMVGVQALKAVDYIKQNRYCVQVSALEKLLTQ